jgi:hypothetical protein
MKALTNRVLGMALVLCGLGTDAVTAGATTTPTDTIVADMFSTAGDGSQPTTATTGTDSPTTTGATTPASFELRAGESVYRSVEEAQRGIEHKDQLIQFFRQQEIQRTGVDPLTGQRVAPGQMSQMGQPQAPIRYIDDPNRYAQDLSEAARIGAQTGDYSKYQAVQRQLATEQMETQFAPYQSVLQNFVETSAVQQVSASTPEFSKFYSSPEFKKTLDANPLLKMGIENAKSNPQFASQLPELYKQVYTVAENARLKAQLAELQKASQINSNAQTQVRPTAQPTTTQPQTGMIQGGVDPRTNPEARKALLKQMEQNGVLDVPISSLAT